MPEEKDTSKQTAEQGASGRRPESRWAVGKRRWLVRLGIAVLVIAVFVVIPGYISTQPKFLRRYPGMAEEYATWSTSVHFRASCQSCHVPPGFIPQAGYQVRMLGEFYLSLVSPSRQPRVFPPPTSEACQSCHLNLRTVSPSGDLNIPHRAHVVVLKMQCVRCHKYLVHKTNPSGKHTPTMSTCLVCHDGHQAKNACATCHTNKDIPVNHRSPNWVVIHPQMQKTINCQQCHKWTEHWCAECHSHRPKSHGADWRTVHGAKVKVHRNCEACHEGAFCVRCHGELPLLNFNPALRLVR